MEASDGRWGEEVCVRRRGVIEVAREMGGHLRFQDAVGGGGSGVGFRGG